jgi:hypothetical protein
MKRFRKHIALFSIILLPLVFSLFQNGEASFIQPDRITNNSAYFNTRAAVEIDQSGVAHYAYVAETVNTEGQIWYGNNTNLLNPGYFAGGDYNLQLNDQDYIDIDLINITSSTIGVPSQGNPAVGFVAEVNNTLGVGAPDITKAFIAPVNVERGEFNLRHVYPLSDKSFTTPYNQFDNVISDEDLIVATYQHGNPRVNIISLFESYIDSGQINLPLPAHVSSNDLGSNVTFKYFNAPYFYMVSGKVLLIYLTRNTTIGSLVGNYTFNHTITDMKFDPITNRIYAVSKGGLFAIQMVNNYQVQFLNSTVSSDFTSSTTDPKMEIDGNYIYVTTSNSTSGKIKVFYYNATTKAFIAQSTTTITAGIGLESNHVRDLEINPTTQELFFAALNGLFNCSIANRTNPTNFTKIFTPYTDLTKITLDISTNRLGLISKGSSTNAFYLKNLLTENTTLQLLPGIGSDIIFDGNYVFVSTTSGLVVYNATHIPTTSLNQTYGIGINYQSLYMKNQILYMSDTAQNVLALNVTNILEFNFINSKKATFYESTNKFQAAIDSNNIYITDPEFGLLIYSRPNNITKIQLINKQPLTGRYYNDIAVCNKYVYLTGEDGIAVVNVNNSANPVEIPQNLPNRNITQIEIIAQGNTNWAYIYDNTTKTIAAISLKIPSNISEQYYNSFKLFYPSKLILTPNNRLFILDDLLGLVSMDIENPKTIVVLENYENLKGFDMAYDKEYIYLLNSTGCTYFHENDFSSIEYESFTGQMTGISVYGLLLYVSTASNGVQIHDLAKKNNILTGNEVDTQIAISFYESNTGIVVWRNNIGTFYRNIYSDGALGYIHQLNNVPGSASSLKIATNNVDGKNYAHIAFLYNGNVGYIRLFDNVESALTTIYSLGGSPARYLNIDVNVDVVGIVFDVYTSNTQYDVKVRLSGNRGANWDSVINGSNDLTKDERFPDIYVKSGKRAEIFYSLKTGADTYTICSRDNFDGNFMSYQMYLLDSSTLTNHSISAVAERNGTVHIIYENQEKIAGVWQFPQLFVIGYQTFNYDMYGDFNVFSYHVSEDPGFDAVIQGVRMSFNTTQTTPMNLTFKLRDRITENYWIYNHSFTATGGMNQEIYFWSPDNYFIITNPYDLYIYNSSDLSKSLWKIAIHGNQLFSQTGDEYVFSIPETLIEFKTSRPIKTISDSQYLFVLSNESIIVYDSDPLYQTGDQIGYYPLNKVPQTMEYNQTNKQLWIACNDSIILLSMLNPTNPQLIDQINLNLNHTVEDIEIIEDRVFITAGLDGLFQIQLNQISNILTLISHNHSSSPLTGMTYVKAQKTLYFGNNTLISYSVLTDSNMIPMEFSVFQNLSTYTNSIDKIAYDQDTNMLICIINKNNGLYIAKLNNPGSIVFDRIIPFPWNEPTDLEIKSNFVYISFLGSGVKAFNITNITVASEIPFPISYGNDPYITDLNLNLPNDLYAIKNNSEIIRLNVTDSTKISYITKLSPTWHYPGINSTINSNYTIAFEPLYEIITEMFPDKKVFPGTQLKETLPFSKTNYFDIFSFNMEAGFVYVIDFTTKLPGNNSILYLLPGNTQNINPTITPPILRMNTNDSNTSINFTCPATGKYYFFIQANPDRKDYLQNSTMGYELKISVQPLKPTLQLPITDQFFRPIDDVTKWTEIQLSWMEDVKEKNENDIWRFHLQIANNSNFSSLVVDTLLLANVREYVFNVSVEGIYYWRVKVIDNAIPKNYGPWSDNRTIKFDNTPPKPVKLQPLALNHNTSWVRLTWVPADDGIFTARRYFIYQIDREVGETLLTPNGQAATNMTVQNLINGRYRFYVIAEDQVGYKSLISNVEYTTVTVGGYISAVNQPFEIKLGEVLVYEVTSVISKKKDGNQNPIMTFRGQEMLAGTQIEFWINFFDRRDPIPIEAEFAIKTPISTNYKVINNYSAVQEFALSKNVTYQREVLNIVSQNLLSDANIEYRTYDTLWRDGTNVYEVYVHSYFNTPNKEGKQSSASFFVEKSTGILCEMILYDNVNDYGYSLKLIETTVEMQKSDWRFGPIYFGLTMVAIVGIIAAIIRKVEFL